MSGVEHDGDLAVLAGVPVWRLALLDVRDARACYPHLTYEQIAEAHQYAHDHPDEIARDKGK